MLKAPQHGHHVKREWERDQNNFSGNFQWKALPPPASGHSNIFPFTRPFSLFILFHISNMSSYSVNQPLQFHYFFHTYICQGQKTIDPVGQTIHSLSHTHTHTHKHTHVGFYRRLFISVMFFILYKPYFLSPYNNPTPKPTYKCFELWGHWNCPHKWPSHCNAYVIPMTQICVPVNHTNMHTHTHTLVDNWIGVLYFPPKDFNTS